MRGSNSFSCLQLLAVFFSLTAYSLIDVKIENSSISSNNSTIWLVDLMVSEKFSLKKENNNILKINH